MCRLLFWQLFVVEISLRCVGVFFLASPPNSTTTHLSLLVSSNEQQREDVGFWTQGWASHSVWQGGYLCCTCHYRLCVVPAASGQIQTRGNKFAPLSPLTHFSRANKTFIYIYIYIYIIPDYSLLIFWNAICSHWVLINFYVTLESTLS